MLALSLKNANGTAFFGASGLPVGIAVGEAMRALIEYGDGDTPLIVQYHSRYPLALGNLENKDQLPPFVFPVQADFSEPLTRDEIKRLFQPELLTYPVGILAFCAAGGMREGEQVARNIGFVTPKNILDAAVEERQKYPDLSPLLVLTTNSYPGHFSKEENQRRITEGLQSVSPDVGPLFERVLNKYVDSIGAAKFAMLEYCIKKAKAGDIRFCEILSGAIIDDTETSMWLFLNGARIKKNIDDEAFYNMIQLPMGGATLPRLVARDMILAMLNGQSQGVETRVTPKLSPKDFVFYGGQERES